jgi:hypothetical protein
MDLGWTAWAIALVTAVFGLCWLRERRPRQFGEVRMFPYIPVMMICLVLLLGLVAHVISLLTGSPVGGQGY